jgi:hypothetical protein
MLFSKRRWRCTTVWTILLSVRLSLAQAALDRDCPDNAKPHLDGALALMSIADSHTAGLYLIGATAAWAAAVGQHDVAVFLDAAYAKQFERAGMMVRLTEHQAEILEHARCALEPDTQEQLRTAGRALDYQQTLDSVRVVLSGGEALPSRPSGWR